MSFAAITLCVASQRVFVVYSVRKLLDMHSYLVFSLMTITNESLDLLRHVRLFVELDHKHT
jgi:hypothetical protein